MPKKSVQRDIIRANILHRFDHPTAEMVWTSVRQTNPRVSLATVYRNLESLVREGEIHRFVVPNEPDHYDATQTEHIHAHCRECGQIFDIDVKLNKRLSERVKAIAGVEVDKVQLIATGVCQKCQ